MDRFELKFKDLKDSGGPCDIILVAANGKQFKAHRQMLSAASPFLRSF